MRGLTIGLGFMALAIAIQRLALLKTESTVRTKGQAFRFHGLRDQMQVFALDGMISCTSPAYSFLISLTNIGIRNAGILDAKSIFLAARATLKEVDPVHTESLMMEIDRQNPAVKKLAADCFVAFGDMLLCNDPLVRSGVRLGHILKPIVRFAARFAPDRSAAVKYGRRLQMLGNSLATS